MSKLVIRPVHRRRKGARKRAAVLNQEELAALLQVPLAQLQEKLDALSWPYHRDSTGALWAKPPESAE